MLAFAGSDDERLLKRAQTITACCCSPLIVVRSDASIGVCPIRCRDRLCPLCALRRSREAATKYGEAVARMGAARHLVLTAPSIDAPLADQLAELRAAMRRLRAQRGWKSVVSGGVYTIEVTRNKKTGLWHPHVHLIIDGEYYPQREAAEGWRRALGTGDLWTRETLERGVIVHISAVHNRHQLARYIAKYIAKPQDLSIWPASAICEYALAVRGARMMHTFGSLHGVKLGVEDPNECPGESRVLIGMAELDWRAIQGHDEAKRGVALLRAECPHVSMWLGAPRDAVLDAWAAEIEDRPGMLQLILGHVKRLTSGLPPSLNQTKRRVNNRNNYKNTSSLFEKNENFNLKKN